MANLMPGALRVDNKIDVTSRVNPNAIQQVQDSGIGRVAAEAAHVFSSLGDTIGQMADTAAQKEGTDAGKIAGLDPEFRTVNNGTIRGNAFDKAGLDVAETRLRQALDAGLDGAFTKFAGDPAGLANAIQAHSAAIIGSAPQELRPGLQLIVRGKQLQFARQQARQQAAERVSEAAGAFDTELADTTKRLHQMAYSSGLDPASDAVLADQVGLYAQALKRRGPDGQLYVAPEKAALEVRKLNQAVATARISGAFDRLPTLDAKLKFIEELQKDYSSGKGIASTYDLDEFDNVGLSRGEDPAGDAGRRRERGR